MSAVEPIAEGRFLHLVRRGTWEFAKRPAGCGVVGVVALTPADRVVLVEQYRPPVDARVIELPAGLVGDEEAAESALAAAQRELLEETGYAAEAWERLTCGLSSPGLTDEAVVFFLARGARRIAAVGGVGGEAITVHEVDRSRLGEWLAEQVKAGRQYDLKLLAGIWAAERLLERSRTA